MKRIRVKKGWDREGLQGTLLHIVEKSDKIGQRWAVVLFDDDEDPELYKVAGLEIEQSTWSDIAEGV